MKQDWIKCEDRLPEPYQEVLITYKSPVGSIIIIAEYVRKLEREVDVDSCSFSEDTYDEETDCCWWPEGWYEVPGQNSGEDMFWRVYPKLYTVTHWMPLPEPPCSE